MNVLKKIWNWIKEHIGIVIGAVALIGAYLLGRKNSYTRAGDSTESALGELGEGIERCQEELERAETGVEHSKERIDAGTARVESSKERIERSEELSDRIAGNIERAEGHAQAIRKILKEAEAVDNG